MTRSKGGARRAGALIAMLTTIGSTAVVAPASVARCGAGEVGSDEAGGKDAGADEFRFIEFDGRWWTVHIELSHDPGTVQLAR